MKYCLLALLSIVAVVFTANAQPFDGSLPRFQFADSQIVWAVKTNRLRPWLWTYKVVPQTFPVKAVNNLLRMGGFTNRITHSDQGISVANQSNTCNLVVFPGQGHIMYWDGFAAANHWDKIKHLVEPVEKVPNSEQVEKLGLKFLKQFGINRADLEQRDDGHLSTHGEIKSRSYYDRRTGKYVDDETLTRGVIFNRRIAGVNFNGIGLNSTLLRF